MREIESEEEKNMKILVTGASGFLGKALLARLSARNTIYALSRHPPESSKNVIPIIGDITEHNLDLDMAPRDIERVYHLAAIHRIGEDKDGSIWKTNVMGTRNVIAFCHKHQIPQLYFCSTAYTIDDGRNTYEKSKVLCDKMVTESGISKVVTFKPSIVMGTKENPYPGHFSQFVMMLIKAHGRAELIRRKVEGTLRLPVIEPVFRIRGNPEGYLNLITVDEVVKGMTRVVDPGIVWLTNPNPSTLGQLADWISDSIMVRFRIQSEEFNRGPIESLVAKGASAFSPYLQGDSFPSHLKNCSPITREFIHDTIISTLYLDKKKNTSYTKR